MAAPLIYIGSSADDFYTQGVANGYTANITTVEGQDTVLLSGDYTDSIIDLGEDADALAIGDFGPGAQEVLTSTILGGSGEDNIGLFLSDGEDNLIELGEGNDRLLLSSVPIAISGLPPVFANYLRNTIFGGDGTDGVTVDNTVNAFNNNIVELGDNDESTLGAFADLTVDFFASGTTFQDLLKQGPPVEYVYLAATEVFQSTIRGGQGEDVLLLESLTGSPSSTDGLDLGINNSLISGNAGDDFIGVARNVENGTTINGGRGNDQFLLLSGTFFDSIVNGNLGADLITFGAIDVNQSTFYGGQGDDTMNVGSAIIKNSLLSGDLGNDKINFFAAQSISNTLSGGAGNDEIDDFSYTILSQGNLLDGGVGNDVLRQAANIAGPAGGLFATFVGGKGQDHMTGDLNTQLLGPKQGTAFDPVNGVITDLAGATSDMFRFRFGDSDITTAVSRRDTITDFDSHASRYLLPGVVAFNNPFINPVTDFANVATAVMDPTIRRDTIDLQEETATPGVFSDVAILNGATNNAGLLAGVVLNTKGRVIGGVGNIQKFVEAGASLTTKGAAIIWQETAAGVAPRSQLFISDGVAGLSDKDLLIQLDQVSGFGTGVGGLVITGGNITDITLV